MCAETRVDEPPASRVDEPSESRVDEPPESRVDSVPETRVDEPPESSVDEAPESRVDEPPESTTVSLRREGEAFRGAARAVGRLTVSTLRSHYGRGGRGFSVDTDRWRSD